MPQLDALTTSELVQRLGTQANLSEAEHVLLDRLTSALEEIDALMADLVSCRRTVCEDCGGQDA